MLSQFSSLVAVKGNNGTPAANGWCAYTPLLFVSCKRGRESEATSMYGIWSLGVRCHVGRRDRPFLLLFCLLFPLGSIEPRRKAVSASSCEPLHHLICTGCAYLLLCCCFEPFLFCFVLFLAVYGGLRGQGQQRFRGRNASTLLSITRRPLFL